MLDLVEGNKKEPLAVVLLHGGGSGIPHFEAQEFHRNSLRVPNPGEIDVTLCCSLLSHSSNDQNVQQETDQEREKYQQYGDQQSSGHEIYRKLNNTST